MRTACSPRLVGAAINDNAWHYVTLTRSAGTIELYMDTTSQGTNTSAGAAGSFTTSLRDIGREGRWIQDNYTTPTTNAFLGATFDELRYSNVVRSIDSITTDYNNQSSPSTFYAVTLGTAGEVTTNATTGVQLDGAGRRRDLPGQPDPLADRFRDRHAGLQRRARAWRQARRHQRHADSGRGLSGGGRRDYQIADLGASGAAAAYWVEEVHFDFLDQRVVRAGDGGDDARVRVRATRPSPVPVVGGGPGATPSSDGYPGFADDGMGGCAVASRRATPAGLGVAAALLALAIAAGRRRRRGAADAGRAGAAAQVSTQTGDMYGDVLNVTVRRAPGFISRAIGDETIVVPVSDGVSNLGSRVHPEPGRRRDSGNGIDGAASVDDLALAVVREFAVDQAVATRDVVEFIDLLSARGLVLATELATP